MTFWSRPWWWASLALGVTGLGCATTPKPCTEPPPLRITLEAGERLNTDDRGRSLPTVVQLLQVRSIRRLEGADFGAVYQRPKEVFEEDLLRVDELTLEPGQTLTREFPREPQAKQLVAVGLFRRPVGAGWRAPLLLDEVRPERCGPGGKGAGGEDARFRFQDGQVEPVQASR
ncbi:MAG TPA: type VI secretion system lipoprotein TssJ [Myxococcaceae bacterium]|nr:type VI secretion system lipoprotein TssJ [Myxococcaceae bacterium]